MPWRAGQMREDIAGPPHTAVAPPPDPPGSGARQGAVCSVAHARQSCPFSP